MMKRLFRILSVVFALLLFISLSSCSVQNIADIAPIQDNETVAPIPTKETALPKLKVHFIDVGQADCILLQLTDGRNVLIDGGNKGDAEVIDGYLKNQGIETLDYIVATHPHEDHIGSLPKLIKWYDVGAIYMPKATANTKVFEDMLLEIKAKGLKINAASAGVNIIETVDTKLSILAPNSNSYEETNEYSAVLKLVYKDTSFLFTGDAEGVSEREMLRNNFDIKADLLKVGHHGGRTSTTEKFLRAVSPKYSIISVGKDNDYGHPHKETLDRLREIDTKIFRTDEQGHIIAVSDGSNITIDKSSSDIGEKAIEPLKQFIGNKSSKVFHLESCTSLPNLDNQVKLDSRDEAIKAGYKPCGRCKP